MRFIVLLFFLSTYLLAEPAKTSLSSESIQEHNPLLPMLEPKLWKRLLVAEEAYKKDPEKLGDFLSLVERITKKHPLKKTKDSITLGLVKLNLKDKTIEIPATLHYPNEEILEVLLCNSFGRAHETLFITDARPLHLELILHYAGFSKKPDFEDAFSIFVRHPDKSEIRVENFLQGPDLPESQTWLFEGSPFKAVNYPPDVNGELILLWKSHDSVLQSSDEDIRFNSSKVYVNKVEKFSQNEKVTVILKPVRSSKDKAKTQ